MKSEYVAHPVRFLRDVNRAYHLVRNRTAFNDAGMDVAGADWDHLLVLDACRFDMFRECSELEGDLQARQSRASMTEEWLEANFDGRDLTDTVYVTANPMYTRTRDEVRFEFHDIVDVWSDSWDEVGTVRPERVRDAAIDAAEQYPDKRLLVHFLQPHYPFLTTDTTFDKNRFDDSGSDPWTDVLLGTVDVSQEELWNGYRENLEVVLPEVEVLCEKLDGRKVVTADHGNMVGERSRPIPHIEYGHPRGLYTSQLVTVPWLVVDGEARKQVRKSGNPVDTTANSEETEARLRDLGYLA